MTLSTGVVVPVKKTKKVTQEDQDEWDRLSGRYHRMFFQEIIPLQEELWTFAMQRMEEKGLNGQEIRVVFHELFVKAWALGLRNLSPFVKRDKGERERFLRYLQKVLMEDLNHEYELAAAEGVFGVLHCHTK